MGLLHDLEAMAESPMIGLQAQQKDWSPFVAHFTSAAAMKWGRKAVTDQLPASEIRVKLAEADKKSFATLCAILTSGTLRATMPPLTQPQRPRVSLSECTLPGLISHAERYGRCGLVSQKLAIYRLGGRPCLYVSRDAYSELGEHSRDAKATDISRNTFDFANVYEPPGAGRIQDFTLEREWRVPRDIRIDSIPPVTVVVPTSDFIMQLPPTITCHIPVIPLTLLHRWGA